MSYSFILYKGSTHSEKTPSLALELTGAKSPAEFSSGDISLVFRDNNTGILFENEGVELRLLPSVVHEPPFDEIAGSIFTALAGNPGNISLPFETPPFIAFHGQTGTLWIYNGIPGLLPVYYHFGNDS